MNTLVLIRGLPGSGKSSLIDMMHIDPDSYEGQQADSYAVSADDYFMRDGNYYFNPSKLGDAHEYCRKRVEQLLACDDFVVRVLVHNTFSCRWEMEPYIKLAEQYGARLVVVDLFDGGLTDQQLFERNVVNVPLDTIKQMRCRWETDWKNGDPRQPWMRNNRG